MAPEITATREVSLSVNTVKSVPRTPIAATGVLKRKFWRACLTALPDLAQDEEAAVDRLNIEEAVGARAQHLAFLHGRAVDGRLAGHAGRAGDENDLPGFSRLGRLECARECDED
jgi:hypothetical protein